MAFLNSILHFDGYLVGGGGVVFTATSVPTDANPKAAPAPVTADTTFSTVAAVVADLGQIVLAFGIGWLILEWQCKKLDNPAEQSPAKNSAMDEVETKSIA